MSDIAKVAKKETKTVFKWWWAWNYEEEEEWLNQKANEGYTLRGMWLCFYKFEKTEPGEYILRIEYKDNDSEYISFMEEMGAERVAYFCRWNYFKRKSNLGEFDVYSDLASRVNHYKRIERTILLVGIANALIGTGNILNVTSEITRFGVINLLLAMMLSFGVGCIRTKRKMLEKEKKIRE